MNKFLFTAIFAAAFFSCCKSEPARPVLNLPLPPEVERGPREYTITDYKNKTNGETIPGWVSLWLDRGNRGVETLSAFQGLLTFVHNSEGSNFKALELWRDNFSPGQDFPRVAARRIEARFSSAALYPDEEYGAFYEAIIRSASDAFWTGASAADDFWIKKKYPPTEEEGEMESWEFLILITMEKALFTRQLEDIFQKTQPAPSPTAEQLAAVNHVKEHFFEGF